MLTLIYAIQDQISKTHAFAFINRLEYISPDFEGKAAENAVSHILDRMPSGYYHTDFGNSLDIFGMLARHSRQTIWLNPEPPTLWGVGDSDMLKYAPVCDEILQVGNPAELTAAVDRLLTHRG
jgi:uncharacterized protein with von Willebrand factor type A (vWA) domain